MPSYDTAAKVLSVTRRTRKHESELPKSLNEKRKSYKQQNFFKYYYKNKLSPKKNATCLHSMKWYHNPGGYRLKHFKLHSMYRSVIYSQLAVVHQLYNVLVFVD